MASNRNAAGRPAIPRTHMPARLRKSLQHHGNGAARNNVPIDHAQSNSAATASNGAIRSEISLLQPAKYLLFVNTCSEKWWSATASRSSCTISIRGRRPCACSTPLGGGTVLG
jgi:hypothetical protein